MTTESGRFVTKIAPAGDSVGADEMIPFNAEDIDGSNVTIAKDITVNVTEVLASFIDNSVLRLPTNWVDKPAVVTSYTVKTPPTTIWIDKG